jgi:hypothetical protein
MHKQLDSSPIVNIVGRANISELRQVVVEPVVPANIKIKAAKQTLNANFVWLVKHSSIRPMHAVSVALASTKDKTPRLPWYAALVWLVNLLPVQRKPLVMFVKLASFKNWKPPSNTRARFAWPGNNMCPQQTRVKIVSLASSNIKTPWLRRYAALVRLVNNLILNQDHALPPLTTPVKTVADYR